MRTLPDEAITQNGFLTCPDCIFAQNDCAVHILGVEVDQLRHVTSIIPGELHDFHRDPRAVRGSIVTIRFWCENGHRFDLEFQFHKGATLVSMPSFPGLKCSEQPELAR